MSQFNENFKTKAEAEAFAEKMKKNGYTNYVHYSTYHDCWKVCRMENQVFIPEEILPSAEIEQMAMDIYSFLVVHDMWQDVTIYFNGKAWSTHTYADSGMSVYSHNGFQRFEYSADPNMYFDYVRNPHILSMSFDGDLYDELNYGGGISDKFDEIIGKYVANDPECGECHCYFELGNSWNLSVSY